MVGSCSEGAGPEWNDADRLADRLVQSGRDAGLPFVAVQGDLGDPAPMADRNGVPYAARLPWVASGSGYWHNRRLALQSTFLQAARICAEPIWFDGTMLGSWRPTRLLHLIDCSRVSEQFGFSAAMIAPVHLAGGQVGAVVWVATDPVDIRAAFERCAEPMFALARRFVATHTELVAKPFRSALGQLSAREVQCMRWAGAGKTNAEIGTILSLSVSTVRFHLRNAGAKLGASTRARAIHVATGHGYLGSHA